MSSRRLSLVADYFGATLWVVPFIAIPLAIVMSRILHAIDAALGWDALGISVSGATAMYQAMISAAVTFMVFTFGSLLIAIQIASGQMTPRIIGSILLRAKVPKYTVALYVFTLIMSLSALNLMDNSVHQLVALSIALLGVFCFAAFFYLIDYASRTLRPVSVLTHVGEIGVDVLRRVYPELSPGPEVAAVNRPVLGPPDRVVVHHRTSAIVLSVDVTAIMREAERSNSMIEFLPQVGDFVASGEALFGVWGGGQDVHEHVLTAAVIFGSERTTEQDPTFAFRIIVDIALKALSPAINDPTTAVLAIDQLENMLRLTGQRHLRNDTYDDGFGRMRLIFRTPNWEDFVYLTFSEIRGCGSNNLQIVRRLRAMIQNLLRALPAHRKRALMEAMSLLDREIARTFTFPEDLALALIPDTQGLGGHSTVETVSRGEEEREDDTSGRVASA